MSTPLALAYIRVSSVAQVETGASLAAQEATLREEATKRGWAVEIIREEGKSAKNLRRPALQAALSRLDRGEAEFLISVRLDRLSRSVADFAGLLDRADRKGWGLVLLSPNIDTSTPAGRFVANVLASAAEYERGLLSVRTKEGMAQRKADGVHLGRPTALPASVYGQILTLRQAGQGFSAIARHLNAEGIPTAHGGREWYPATVKRIVESETAKALA